MNEIKKDRIFIVIFIFAMFVRLLYLSYTINYETRSYDAEGHLAYINYIAIHEKLPPPNACWECWQPPIYYVTAVTWSKLTDMILLPRILSLQLYSLAVSLLFLTISLAILNLLFKNNKTVAFGFAIIAFFPSLIIHSVRISNDPLYYLLSAISLFYLFEWKLKQTKATLFISVCFACLSILTKSSGFIIAGVTLIIYCHELFRSNYRLLMLKKGIPLMIPFILLVMITMRLSAVRNSEIIGNIRSLNEELIVGNSVNNFTQFDVFDFIKNPYTDPWDDRGNRQSLVSYFTKTAMYGEFSYDNPLQTNVAKVNNFLILMIGCVSVFGITHLSSHKHMKGFFIMFTFLVVSLAAVIVMRIKYPYSAVGDFRMVAPVIIPFAYFVMQALETFENDKKTHIFTKVLITLIICFSLGSILFFNPSFFK